MKTIEESIIEIKKSPVYKKGDEYLFKAGVEFAQQWISVEIELPEVKDKSYQILAKKKPTPSGTIIHRVIVIFSSYSKNDIDIKIKQYAHWRPISFL